MISYWSSRHGHACPAINYFKVTFFDTFIIWSESVLYLSGCCMSCYIPSFSPFLILAIHCNRRREILSMPKYSLKGHLQTVCVAVVHLTEIICCNTEITNVLIVFENRIVSSQPKEIASCDTLLKRNRYNSVIKHRNHVRDFCIIANGFRWGARPQCTLVEGAPFK